MIPLAGCASSSDSPVGTWGDPDVAYLELGPDGALSGSDGCNGVGGSYRPDGDTATIRRGPSTLRACPGVDTWLRGAAKVRVDGDTLHVFNSKDEEIGTLTRAHDA